MLRELTDYWDYSKPPPQYAECDAKQYDIECLQVEGKRRYCALITNYHYDTFKADVCPYFQESEEQLRITHSIVKRRKWMNETEIKKESDRIFEGIHLTREGMKAVHISYYNSKYDRVEGQIIKAGDVTPHTQVLDVRMIPYRGLTSKVKTDG